MTTIMPQSELLRKAVHWMAETSKESGRPALAFLDDAAQRFNLSPKECEYLANFFKQPCTPGQ